MSDTGSMCMPSTITCPNTSTLARIRPRRQSSTISGDWNNLSTPARSRANGYEKSPELFFAGRFYHLTRCRHAHLSPALNIQP
jgi:hypothetical protein